MPSSSLDPDITLENDRQLGKGHGLDALGPGDLSDTGSDALGAYADDNAAAPTKMSSGHITTTDLPDDPAFGENIASEVSIDPDIDSELAIDPTKDLDLNLLADVNAELDDDELLDEEEPASNSSAI